MVFKRFGVHGMTDLSITQAAHPELMGGRNSTTSLENSTGSLHDSACMGGMDPHAKDAPPRRVPALDENLG